jgi:hypothetical protein
MSEKEKIIAAIEQTEDEWVLLAIKRLLRLEEEPEAAWQEEIVAKRYQEMLDGKADFMDWEAVKKQVFK